nr:hypothetical protein [Lachnospiraceae bacterium]
QAARMFTQHAGNISFHATEGEPATIPCSTNDDPEFLDDLIRVRDEMIQELQEQNPALTAKDFILSLDELLRRMFAFACNAQSASLGQNDTFTFRFLRESHIIPQSRPDTSPINATEGPSLFPLPLHTLRGLLDSSLYHPNLSYSNPTLHELMQDAFRYIDSAKQESLWQSHTADFFSRHPETMRLYTGYLTYYLHQYFLRIYETYSYRRQVALGIIHMNLLLLLDVTYEKRHGSLSSEEFSQILAVYNRRAYFSDKIQDTLYRIFEDAIV